MENFYDHGWNGYVDGLPCPPKTMRQAWDGWKDAHLCHELDGEVPKKMD